MNHSPEPWEVEAWNGTGFYVAIVSATDETIMELSGDSQVFGRAIANADRIVACVNAMEGIPSHILPTVKKLLGSCPVADAKFIETFLNHIKKGETHV